MGTLDHHQSSSVTKILLLGDSGSGKTGALASLVEAGYKLRVLDFDNGLDSLVQAVKKRCPEKLSSVVYRTLQDKVKSSPVGPILDGSPTAFIEATKLLDNWKTPDEDLGPPARWGGDCILVLDSLTFFSDAAMHFAEVYKMSKDRRQIFGAAQDAIEYILGMFKSETFNTNVIITAHVRYIERDTGAPKGYPKSVGTALSPTIPAYFNTTVMMETEGAGANARRTLKTAPTGLVDLKNAAAITKTYPIETGLAELFKELRA